MLLYISVNCPMNLCNGLYDSVNVVSWLNKNCALFNISLCKFRNFHKNFIFTNSVKRHICHFKISQLGHDLPTFVKDRVISPFHAGLIFTFEKNPKFFLNLLYVWFLLLVDIF